MTGKASGLAWIQGRGAFTHIFQLLECPGETWVLVREEQVALTKTVPFKPSASAKTLKACALVGLIFLAAKGEAGSGGSQSPDLGDMWRCGCPKSPDWDGDVESWTESEGTSSSQQCEHNVESLALNVTGKTSEVK